MNEKAIAKLKDILEEATETDDSVCYVTSDDADVIKAGIKALEENKKLKNRCYTLSSGTLCLFCPLECEHRSCDFRNKESEE